jgi:hypothetical protein
VTDQFFALLGTSPALGRTFVQDEFRPGGPRVAIYSHHMWQSRAAGDPNIVGQLVRLDEGEPYRVVGVLPRGLELRLFNDCGRRPEPFIWLPKQGYTDFERTQRGLAYYNVFGRLRPSVTAEQAQAEFDALSADLARAYPSTNATVGADVVPLRAHLLGSLRDVLPLLVGAASTHVAGAGPWHSAPLRPGRRAVLLGSTVGAGGGRT